MFYDADGVRYHRLGETGHYRYEEVSSVLEGESSPLTDAMVTRALEYRDCITPSEIQAQLQEHQLESEEGLEVGTQSSAVILETPHVSQD